MLSQNLIESDQSAVSPTAPNDNSIVSNCHHAADYRSAINAISAPIESAGNDVGLVHLRLASLALSIIALHSATISGVIRFAAAAIRSANIAGHGSGSIQQLRPESSV